MRAKFIRQPIRDRKRSNWICGHLCDRWRAVPRHSPLIPNVQSAAVVQRWFPAYGSHIGEVPSKIYQVEIATGKESVVQELNPGVPAGVVMVGPIVVSRNGTQFLYSYNQTLSILYVVSGLR